MRKSVKFPGLVSEMAKRGETQEDIGKVLNLSRVSVSKKLTGKVDWTIGEIEDLCEYYGKDYYELFK